MNNFSSFIQSPGAPRRKEIWLVLSILLFSLAMRIFAMLRVDVIGTDGVLYCKLAQEILEGRWLESNRTLLFNPYPVLIAFSHYYFGISEELSGKLINALACGTAVLPLYLWVRDAFDRRTALATGWIYALHPMLIRYGAPVMRDGLYWFFLLLGVHLLWSAITRGGFLRFFCGGIFATAATQVRTEGASLFLLLCLWGICWPRIRSGFRFEYFRRGLGTACACLIFPITLWSLNSAFLPRGEAFSGLERFGFVVADVSRLFSILNSETPALGPVTPVTVPAPQVAAVTPIETAAPAISAPTITPAADSVPINSPPNPAVTVTNAIPPIPEVSTEVKTPPSPNSSALSPIPENLADSPPHTTLSTSCLTVPPPQSLQEVMDLIPVWNTHGDNIEPDGYYLRRFLMLSDEYRYVIFGAQFLNQAMHSFRLPILFFFGLGLYVSRRKWSFGRDMPLLVYSMVLVGALLLHLAKTNILEARYLLSLIPFVFPWAGKGLLISMRWGRRWLRLHGYRTAWIRPIPLIGFFVLVSGFWAWKSFLSTSDEAFLKNVGQALQREVRPGDSIFGYEAFARVGYYTHLPYQILPPQQNRAWELILENHPNYVLLRGPQASCNRELVRQLDELPLFERMFKSDPRFSRYAIYRLKLQTNPQISASKE